MELGQPTIAGGVALMMQEGLKLAMGDKKIIAGLSYCTDNGAMISYLGKRNYN